MAEVTRHQPLDLLRHPLDQGVDDLHVLLRRDHERARRGQHVESRKPRLQAQAVDERDETLVSEQPEQPEMKAPVAVEEAREVAVLRGRDVVGRERRVALGVRARDRAREPAERRYLGVSTRNVVHPGHPGRLSCQATSTGDPDEAPR
jgi:hypothetical protein